MFMPLDVVKREHGTIARWQLRDCFIQSDSVDHRHRVWVFGALYDLHGSLTVIRCCFHSHSAFTEVHQNLVDGEPMKPGRKGRLTPEASNFSKELYEDLLSEVLRLRHITGHSQAERVNATIMAPVKLLKGIHLPLSGSLSQSEIRFLMCLDVGCGHVFRLFQASDEVIQRSSARSQRRSQFRNFQGGRTAFPSFPCRFAWTRSTPERGCDAAL